MQNLWLVIIVFFLILLIIPIFVKINFNYDFINNLGAVSLYVFFIKIIAYKIRIKDSRIQLFTQKKLKEVEVKISDKQLRFIKQLTIQIKEKVIIKKITFFSNIGGGADIACLGSGLFNIIVTIIMGYLKTLKKSINYEVYNNPDFYKNSIDYCIIAKCFITIFDIVYALVISAVIIKRSDKYERI